MSLPEARFSTPSPSPSPPPPCDYSEWSPSLVFIPSVYVLVFVLGSLGNGLVLWVYLGRPRGRVARVSSCSKSSKPKVAACSGPSGPSSSRSITDSLIASLAAADLAFVLTLPLWAAYTALGYHWPFGKPLCQVSSYVVTLNMYASVFSLTGLSVERYWVIARRRRTRATRGAQLCRASVVVCVVWGAAGVLALPALLLRTVKQVVLGSQSDEQWPDEEEEGEVEDTALSSISSCDMDYSSLLPAGLVDEGERERLEVLWGAALGLKSTLLGFLLPLAVLLLCYCSLGRVLAQHFRESPRPDRRRQRRLLRVIVTLVLAFFLCWLPYHANKSLAMLVELDLLPYSCPFDQLLLLAHPYTICLGYVNSCLNPLLYACCDTAFRRRCKALLKNMGCRSRCSQGPEAEEEEEEEEEEESGSRSRSSAIPSGLHTAGDSQKDDPERDWTGQLRGVGNGESNPCGTP
ncbi:apelin receptor 2 [Sardina pilchardus]|uniref:apelin receptor 2 n=1 Tax=Sardina pilchardus TaxID=27697 RepID=UPI002E0D5E0A